MGYILEGERLEILKLGDSISIHTNGRTFCLNVASAEQLIIGLALVLYETVDRAQTEDMIETYQTPRSGLKTNRPTLEDI